VPHWNFDSFLQAFITVFIVQVSDGWCDVFFDYYRASVRSPIISTIFFISLIVIGHIILLNLFLAILLKEFDERSFIQEKIEQEQLL
jgi:hypothetical protein